jgi:hypothetical protein
MTKQAHHADKPIFYVCLTMAVLLFVGGFFCPPIGVIDGSVLTAAGILLGFAALGIAGQNLANGKDVIFHHGQTEITIGEDNDDEK